jgi:D-aspartate ligase
MTNNQAANPGAVIIDGHGRADLGVARALGECGVPIYLFTDERGSDVSYSRYITEVFPLPPPEAGEEARVAALLDLGRQFDHRPVFFSTGDSSLVLFSRHRETLQAYYRHHLSAPELIEDLYDKVRFSRLAETHGLDVPVTIVPSSRAELEAALPRLTFPIIVKPAHRSCWAEDAQLYALADGNLKGVRLESPEALLAFYRATARDGSSMVVQDYVDGRDEQIYAMHAYIDRSGELAGCFTGQKLRTYPIHGGIGCFQVSVYEADVVKVALGALKKLGYRGHAEVDVKRAPDGTVRILEINPRYSTWNYLHARAGVNLAYAAYRDCLGEKPKPLPRQREGLRWIDAGNDIRALDQYRRAGDWDLASWSSSYLGRNCFAVFSLNDPLPALVRPARLLGRAATYSIRHSRRIITRLAAAQS